MELKAIQNKKSFRKEKGVDPTARIEATINYQSSIFSTPDLPRGILDSIAEIIESGNLQNSIRVLKNKSQINKINTQKKRVRYLRT